MRHKSVKVVTIRNSDAIHPFSATSAGGAPPLSLEPVVKWLSFFNYSALVETARVPRVRSSGPSTCLSGCFLLLIIFYSRLIPNRTFGMLKIRTTERESPTRNRFLSGRNVSGATSTSDSVLLVSERKWLSLRLGIRSLELIGLDSTRRSSMYEPLVRHSSRGLSRRPRQCSPVRPVAMVRIKWNKLSTIGHSRERDRLHPRSNRSASVRRACNVFWLTSRRERRSDEGNERPAVHRSHNFVMALTNQR